MQGIMLEGLVHNLWLLPFSLLGKQHTPSESEEESLRGLVGYPLGTLGEFSFEGEASSGTPVGIEAVRRILSGPDIHFLLSSFGKRMPEIMIVGGTIKRVFIPFLGVVTRGEGSRVGEETHREVVLYFGLIFNERSLVSFRALEPSELSYI